MFASSQYSIKHLTTICIDHIHSKINKNNACALLETASILGEKELKKFALEYIYTNTSYITQTDGFLSLSKPSLLNVLKSNLLVVNECELFLSILDWARYKLVSMKNPNSDIKFISCKLESGKKYIKFKGKELEDIKLILKDVLPFIRFPLMTADSLLDIVEPTNVCE